MSNQLIKPLVPRFFFFVLLNINIFSNLCYGLYLNVVIT